MKLLFSLFFLLNVIFLNAQTKTIVGTVKDSHSEEPILYASIKMMHKPMGKQTNEEGKFIINVAADFSDTLQVSCIGYDDKEYPINNIQNDTLFLNIYLDRAKSKNEVVVKTKLTRGLLMWRRIVKYKDKNDRFNNNNASYDLYNKMELDIVNLNKEKLKEIKLLKPFAFILNNMDTTSEIKPFLPIFLTETFSKYYMQNQPKKSKEIITASQTSGMDNESVSKLLGGMYQNINLYNNFISIFDIDFVSPFSDNGDSYYKYKVVDTQMIGNSHCFKLTFKPKHEGDNTFVGDCWVHDTTWAVINANLTLDKSSNINYVEKLTMFQELKRMPNDKWVLNKEKFIVNVAPVGKNNLTITGRKTTNYSNYLINNDSITKVLSKNKTKADIVLETNAMQKESLFWEKQRPELLSKNENSIYKLMDTLSNMPLFKTYSHTINFLATGTKYFGNIEIGPWYNWISANSVEGTRLRFDLATNTGFHKKLYLHCYAAYGFKDNKYKGKLEALYLFNREPRTTLYASYQTDYDNGQTYYDEVSTDNIFTLAIRKPNVPSKYLYIKQQKFEFFRELPKGFSLQTGISHKEFTPIKNLPDISDFPTHNSNYEPLNNFEAFVKIRYAFLERFIESNFFRTSLGSPKPIVEFKYSHGFQGVFKSAYKYDKIGISISDYIKLPPYGNISYNIYGGKVFGNLPFMLLEMHPGNEIFYYNKYAFNMMNRFEYISDEFAGVNFEHNIGNGLFKYIPITRKLKFRQFWNTKVLWGNLSDANKAINIKTTNAFKTVNNSAYVELGTGVDNILKFLRIDLVWRVAPHPLPDAKYQRFAIFGSFRVAF